MRCQAIGCRYSQFHNTSAHQCGLCMDFGHSRVGCPKNNKGTTYVGYTTMDPELVKLFLANHHVPRDNYVDSLIFTPLPNGHYTEHSIGMGMGVVARNNNGKYQYFTIGDGTSGSDLMMYRWFTHGYQKRKIYLKMSLSQAESSCLA